MQQKMPNPLIHRVAHTVSCSYVHMVLNRLYNAKLVSDADPLPAAPYMMIANHGTFFDPWLIGAYSKEPLSYMCNDDAFRGSDFSKKYLYSIGAYPKKKGTSDFGAMKETIRRLKKGMPVCIFPEGQTTWDGGSQLIYKGIEKIVRSARSPLVMYKLSGNFLTKPWWAEHKRRGQILVQRKVVEASALKVMSDDEVFGLIKQHIAHNDIKDNRYRRHQFQGTNCAEGIERLVWWCPSCENHDSLVAEGDLVTCETCLATFGITASGHVQTGASLKQPIEDVFDWSDAQREIARRQATKGDSEDVLTSTRNVGLYRYDRASGLFTHEDTGNISLTRTYLQFSGHKPNSARKWDVGNIEDAVIQKRDIVEFSMAGCMYRLQFSHKSPMKWLLYIKYLNGFRECEQRGWL